jgi:hypothetical protein
MINLSVETVNAILGYLGARPYQEVYQLIAAIQAAAAPKEEPPSE